MKRALALTAIAISVGVAVGGCRGDVRDARQPDRPAAVQTSPPAKTQPSPAAKPAQEKTDVSQDLSYVDQMLRDMDDQLTKADASPADGD
jgi:hypothetical protein